MAGDSLKAVAESRRTLIAIQNSGMQLAEVTISCLSHGRIHQSTITIPASGMQLLQGCENFTVDFNTALQSFSSSPAASQDDYLSTLERESGIAYQVSSTSSELAVFGLGASIDHQRARTVSRHLLLAF